jgi:hypothetical protein
MHADELKKLTRSLAAEFPAFEFTTQQTTGGRSLVAEPRPGIRTTLRVVITSDPDEMRSVLKSAAPASRRRKRRKAS